MISITTEGFGYPSIIHDFCVLLDVLISALEDVVDIL